MNAHTGKNGEFFQNVKNNVYEGKFKELNRFEYSCFKFEFKLDNEQYQREFSNFLYFNDPLMPWDICNFFMSRNIRFSINFRYCPSVDLKSNYILSKTVLFLKKEIIRINILKNYNKIKTKLSS